MPDARFEVEVPFSDSDIRQIESAIGRELPKSHTDFVKKYGGAFVGGLVDGSDDLPILTFFDTSKEKSVLASFGTHPDLRGDGVLPIADCELGNLYVLDRDNTVHYISYYGGKTEASKVADTFEDFVARIVVDKE